VLSLKRRATLLRDRIVRFHRTSRLWKRCASTGAG
jgi:hypothetical protein